jgi:hypothetical protein
MYFKTSGRIILLGLLIISLSRGVSGHVIEAVGRVAIGGQHYSIDLDGDFAYLTSRDSGLTVVDCADPAHPTKVTSIYLEREPQGIDIDGAFAYIAHEDRRVSVISIANPYAPAPLSQIDSTCHAKEIFVDSLAYVAYCLSGIRVLDITDPANPIYLSTFNTAGLAWDICERNGILYIADKSGGFCTIDARDPVHPVFLDTLQSPSSAHRLRLEGEYIYLIDTYDGLVIIDINDPANVRRISSTYIPYPRGIDIFENFAVVSRGTMGLRVYDISNPHSPAFVDSINTIGAANEVQIRDGYVYVADESYLSIFRLISTGIREEEGKPHSLTLAHSYPNPFNGSTTIAYLLPHESNVIIEFFDVNGRRVETAMLGIQPAGDQTFNWEARNLSSGIYFYHFRAGELSETNKCVLLK